MTEGFDLIFHPVSNVFIPDVRPVWAECARVLRPGGDLLSGFVNPVEYMFDPQLMEIGELKVKYALPYSDLESLTQAERAAMHGEDAPLGVQPYAGGAHRWADRGWFRDHRFLRGLPQRFEGG